MRLVFASQQYPPETADGGIGTQTYAKAHGLAALGHDVVVVSHSRDENRHEYRDGDVTVVRIPGFDDTMPMHSVEAWWLTYSALLAAEIAALHRRAPVDLVDFPEYGSEGFLWLLNRPADDRVPTVVHLHGSLAMLAGTIGWPEPGSEFHRVGTFMEGTCVRLADRVFSSSLCSADWCTRAYGVTRESIEVMHTGIDLDHFVPRPHDVPNRPTIVFVGRITESKGVGTLVDAVTRLAARIPDVQLRLIGHVEPSYRALLQARAAAYGQLDLLEFVGYLDRRALPGQLARGHVFAAPSKYEGGPGFVYLEAMACGLPVIACSGSGAAEAVVDGATGILVPPDDVERLAHALKQLLTNDTRRIEMGVAARHHVMQQADTTMCLRRIESFYQATVHACRNQVTPAHTS